MAVAISDSSSDAPQPEITVLDVSSFTAAKAAKEAKKAAKAAEKQKVKAAQA